MLIGIEAERANHAQKTGVEFYAQELILNLAKIDSKNHYRLYLRSQPEEWFFSLPKNFEIKVLPFPIFWTQIRLSLELLFHPVDRLFVPASALPLIHPKKSICTIHDAAFLFYPEADTFFMRNYLKISYAFIAKTAWRIVSISQSTKNDLIKYFSIPTEKIRVIYHGYNQGIKETDQNDSKILKNLPEKYLLFVSTLQPRKNLEGLISGFRIFKNKYPHLLHKLVVVGKPGWKFKGILDCINQNQDIVTYLGRVEMSDRNLIYKKAQAFAHASFYEGFGMWLLEAFEAKIPVAVSDNSSLPEVGGKGALYFNPNDPNAIADAIEKILLDEPLRQALVLQATKRLSEFSWEKTAQQTLSALIEN